MVLPLLARAAGLGAVISLMEGGEARGKFDYMRQARLLPDAKSRAFAGRIVTLDAARSAEEVAKEVRERLPGLS